MRKSSTYLLRVSLRFVYFVMKVRSNGQDIKFRFCLQSLKSNTENGPVHISPPGNQNINFRKTPPSYRDPPDPNTPYVRILPPYRDPPPPALNTSKNMCKFVTSPESTVKIASMRSLKVFSLDVIREICIPYCYSWEICIGWLSEWRRMWRVVGLHVAVSWFITFNQLSKG